VLDLEDKRLTAVFETVDKGESPQRAAPVEVLPREVSVQTIKLRIPTGRGQYCVGEMIVKIEREGVDEHGVAEPERDGLEDQAELRHLVESPGHVPADVVKRERHGYSVHVAWRAQERECHDVHGLLGQLHGEIAGVESREPPHSPGFFIWQVPMSQIDLCSLIEVRPTAPLRGYALTLPVRNRAAGASVRLGGPRPYRGST
jgi:hypothetical protein